MSPATVSRILRRLGLNRARDLEPAEPMYHAACGHEGLGITLREAARTLFFWQFVERQQVDQIPFHGQNRFYYYPHPIIGKRLCNHRVRTGALNSEAQNLRRSSVGATPTPVNNQVTIISEHVDSIADAG